MTSSEVISYFEKTYFDPAAYANDPNINKKYGRAVDRLPKATKRQKVYARSFSHPNVQDYFDEVIEDSLRVQIRSEFKEKPRAGLSIEDLEKLRSGKKFGAQYFL